MLHPGYVLRDYKQISYLCQIHLTRLLFNATIHPKHINYSCYELGIFYLALINIAKSHRFSDLACSLTQIHNSIFLNKYQSSLIKSHSSSFQSWYHNEISLYQDQFLLHFNHTTSGKVTFITNLASDIKTLHTCKIMDTYKNPKYDFYQKQLAFKLIEYLYLDSIFVEFSTRKIITELMGYINSDASEDDKQKKLEFSVKAYKDILLKELKNRLLNSSRETVLDLSLCDYHNLVFDLVSFTNVSFVNFDRHTQLPNEFRFCIFKNITFNEQMFKNTKFYDCIFINCFFNKLNISCDFKACYFEKCNLTDLKIRFSDLSDCTLFECDINNLQFYRVTAVGMTIKNLILQNTAIIFSDIRNCIFNDVTFYAVSFEGTFLNISTRFRNCHRMRASDNTLETTLQGAIMLSNIGDNEYIFDDIRQIWESHISNEDFYNPLIITTELLGVQLLTYTQSELINNSLLDSNLRLVMLLGWILCAVDRLKEYCEDFEKNPAFRTFDTFTVFEIVAVHVKTAMTHLNRFLSLYDRCHLSLMNQTLLKNGLFKNFQQYQQKTNFRPESYPQLGNIHLKETLFAIHELHQSIEYIDKIFSLIRNKIDERMVSTSRGRIKK